MTTFSFIYFFDRGHSKCFPQFNGQDNTNSIDFTSTKSPLPHTFQFYPLENLGVSTRCINERNVCMQETQHAQQTRTYAAQNQYIETT